MNGTDISLRTTKRGLVQFNASGTSNFSYDASIATHFVYDSFGAILSGNTSLTRYLFTSREFDADTNLQYNRARYYDAATGRWLSNDPLGFAAGDTNIYRYVGNNATNLIDPSGLEFEPVIGTIGLDGFEFTDGELNNTDIIPDPEVNPNIFGAEEAEQPSFWEKLIEGLLEEQPYYDPREDPLNFEKESLKYFEDPLGLNDDPDETDLERLERMLKEIAKELGTEVVLPRLKEVFNESFPGIGLGSADPSSETERRLRIETNIGVEFEEFDPNDPFNIDNMTLKIEIIFTY